MRLFSRAYFDTLFTIGLLLAVTVNLNRQYLFLPDFVSDFLQDSPLCFYCWPDRFVI